MKAFLSYSLNDQEDYIVTLASQQLQEQDFYVTSGSYKTDEQGKLLTLGEINSSTLFIGVITKEGDANKRVYEEWQQSINRKIPSILMVEDSVILTNEKALTMNNVVRFNRNHPDLATSFINSKINKTKQIGPPSSDEMKELMPWVMGGLVILLLIVLLATKDEGITE